MTRWYKEPLLQFFFAGALLFVASIYLAPAEDRAGAREIVVTEDTRAFLRARFERVWQRPPTAAEEQSAVDEWVREEILFREGMQLGLAQSDPIARRRIGQKLMMLADAMIPALPDESTLQAWYEERAQDYLEPRMFSFQQRFFAGDAAAATGRAQSALDALAAGEAGAPAGDPTLLPPALDAARASYVVASFGEEFASTLRTLPLDTWAGPVSSAFGAHLVKLTARSGGGRPDFAAVREEVERDWLYEQTNQTREKFYRQLRASYQVTGAAGGARDTAE